MENRINHIIARVLSGESSSDDILSLSEWLNENEKNRDEFRRLKNYWDADVAFKHSVAPAFSADKLQQKINVQRRQTARRQLWRNAIPLIAAACLLFIFSTALFLYNTNNRTSEHYTLLTDEHTSNFTLEDGTVITLNKNSRLSYSDKYGKDSRNVKLEGEAYFSVASDAEKPFIVKTSNLSVRVLGTKFNISAYLTNDRTIATLNSGKIQVNVQSGKTDSKYILKPNQEIVFNKIDNSVLINTVTGENSSWKDGSLVFQDATFNDIVNTIERRYGITVDYDKQEFLNTPYTIKFIHNESLEDVLNVLQDVVGGFEYKQKNSKVTIIKKGGSK